MKHLKLTNSSLAKNIIKNWEAQKKNFWQVVPFEILDKLDHPISINHRKEFKKKFA